VNPSDSAKYLGADWFADQMDECLSVLRRRLDKAGPPPTDEEMSAWEDRVAAKYRVERLEKELAEPAMPGPYQDAIAPRSWAGV
jgi:hypothetical protein